MAIKRVKIAIMLATASEDIEVVVPADLWRRSGMIVELVSIEKKNTIVLQSGTKISCNSTIDKTNLSQYNAIYMPGGEGHLKYLDLKANPKLKKNLEKDFLNNKDKYILSMCATPSVLIEWDLIKSRKFTSYPGFGDKLKKNYVDKPVHVDGTLITGRSPGSVFEFSLKVIEVLVGEEARKKVEKEIIYKKTK
ncbi:MAG: DJ-1/PfpI family protein [Mycoplasmoidaceae bacterium]